MEAERCPKCNASTVIAGHVSGNQDGTIAFIPRHVRLFRRSTGVSGPNNFDACTSCGHVWTSLAPEKLRAFIVEYGEELARQHLKVLHDGPLHDLPDTPEAREAAGRVAEIDSLVLGGKQAEATRRYRQLTQATWDEAIDAVQGWRKLGREKKLTRFGWRPKEMPRPGRSERPEHPMHDRLLDG